MILQNLYFKLYMFVVVYFYPILFDFLSFLQHLVEGLLNFRRRVCQSFWLDLAFQDPPGKTDQCCLFIICSVPPTKLSTRVLKPQRGFFS